MSFSSEHAGIYTEGIEPAVVEAGYDPFCLKGIHTNEDINFRIVAEIRKAQIVVADFTGQKNGVYFEAGFARALGKEVYQTCAQAAKDGLHFDTNHFQHTLWNDHGDLKEGLCEKILAISGPGPRRPARHS